MEIQAEFPPKLEILFRPKRYKILYGGRGGAKSWGVARALLIRGAREPIRVICAREFQNSLSESVHQLLEDQVLALGLAGFYAVQQAKIIGANGTEFVFVGIRNNINNVKSFEGADVVWVEEAVNVSKRSWDVLIPTIRKAGSEIWISFNPELETDETYRRFVLHPPTDSYCVSINWRDNPWFPDVLRSEMADLKARDPDAWLNVWEGCCKQTLDGAIYAKELRQTLADGRRCRVLYDPTRPVQTFWDLGRSDATCIWFAQLFPFEKRMIDYLEGTQQAIGFYIKELQAKPYVYETHWLPHDAKHKTIIHELSVEGQMRAAGMPVRVVPNELSVADGINAARTVFPTLYFDEVKTQDGWQGLSHYQYEVDSVTNQFSKKPLHNWASHPADAFRTFAVAQKEPKRQGLQLPKRNRVIQTPVQRNGSWMV